MKAQEFIDSQHNYTGRVVESLRDWFKEKWVRFNPQGKIMGACARGGDREGKPKCLPQAKAHALGKKGRASAAAKKRREDPNPERKGKAKNVATKVRENNQSPQTKGHAGMHWPTSHFAAAYKNAVAADAKVVRVTSDTYKVVPLNDPRPALMPNPGFAADLQRLQTQIENLDAYIRDIKQDKIADPYAASVAKIRKAQKQQLALRKQIAELPKAVEATADAST